MVLLQNGPVETQYGIGLHLRWFYLSRFYDERQWNKEQARDNACWQGAYIMDILAIYKWTAIITGGIFLIQFAASLFGLDGLDDADSFDHAGEGFGGALLSFLSVRNVVCFLLAFSVTGYFGIKDYNWGSLSAVFGVTAGVGLVAFNMYLMRALSKLKRDTSVDETELPGRTALVVFPILANRAGQGKIDVKVDGKVMNLFALTDESEDLLRNTPVVIDHVLDGWIVLVRKQ